MDKTTQNHSLDSQLCLSCGICCRGIFFYHDNDPFAFGRSPEVQNPLFPMACRLLHEQENSCVIHDNPARPSLCQTFQCQVLKSLLRNEISLEQARHKVKAFGELLISVLSRLPHDDAVTPRPVYLMLEKKLAVLRQELENGNRENLNLFMDIIWLRLLIARYIISP